MSAANISIVVCTYNRAGDLSRLLDSLSRVIVPRGITVDLIIVDNGSTDDTKAVIDTIRSSFPMPISYVREFARGSGAARACGVRHATGELIAWTDDDCIVSSDWLIEIDKFFKRNEDVQIVGGRVELYDRSHFPITIITREEKVLIDNKRFPCELLLGCNLVFKNNVFESVQFDPRFGAGTILKGGEDADLLYAAQNHGMKMAYSPEIMIYHNHKRSTTKDVMEIRANYVISDGAFLAKYIMKLDTRAVRIFYWRMTHLINGMFSPSAFGESWPAKRLLPLYMIWGAIQFIHLEVSFAVRKSVRRMLSSFKITTRGVKQVRGS